MKQVLGTAFGWGKRGTTLGLTCLDCWKTKDDIPLDISMEEFHKEQDKFSEEHRVCRGGQDEPDWGRRDD